MKKKVLAAIGAMAVATVIGFAFSQSGVVNADPNLTHDDVRKRITEQYPGNIKELELEKKGKKAIYEAEIELDGKEYDIKIDGNTGDVLKLEETVLSKKNNTDSKVEKLEITEKSNEDTNNEHHDDNKQREKNTSKQTVISLEEAKNIALNNFSGKITEMELDEDDDRLIYEVQMEEGNKEADIEIDAYTGKIIMIKIETDED
ncbi:PepSY domain-containing protein [Oceanobacillus sp. Castelsardo]|uniref:PepSY domain-containing protein n=1 Tax=Oceanobacillus sp. Castelsardo TaxID=1851204 RepID=UPI0008392BF4|nr:PepSY domain-containing protein [Oceanobacillus sp. Castelsardo]